MVSDLLALRLAIATIVTVNAVSVSAGRHT
jgi:hypothetical protein